MTISQQFLKACQNDPIAALNLLHRFPAINVDIRTSNKRTPLHFAVMSNHIGLMTTLLEKGANPNAQDELDNTPLHEAVSNSSPEIIGLLLLAGASLELKNLKEQTPISLAKSNGNIALLSKAIQICCQHLNAQKQQGLAKIKILKQAIAEQEKLIANHEEMIRQQELNLQRLQSKIQFANLRTFEQLQTLASHEYLQPTVKTLAASPYFEDVTSKCSQTYQAPESAVASTSSQSTSQVMSRGLL